MQPVTWISTISQFTVYTVQSGFCLETIPVIVSAYTVNRNKIPQGKCQHFAFNCLTILTCSYCLGFDLFYSNALKNSVILTQTAHNDHEKTCCI